MSQLGMLVQLLLVCLLSSCAAFVIIPSSASTRRLSSALPAAAAAASSSSPMASIKGILFDMDGTLTQSDDLHYECYRDTLLRMAPEHNDGQPLERAFYDKHLSGSANEIIVPKLLPHWEHERMKELWLAKETLYRERSVHMKPLPGVLKILDWCEQLEVPKLIVTNAPRIDAEHTLHTLKLRDRFPDVVISEECSRPKPFPDPYLEGLARLGLKAEDCIAFEDSFSGMAAAQAAGLRTVAVLTCREEEEMLARGAFMAIQNFEDERLWEFLVRG